MKLDNETIVHRYGKALFELAEEMKIRNKFHSELQEYKKVLQNEPQLKVFMSSNQISPEAKLKIMEILKKDSSKLMTNLLDMLYDYGRITSLEGIIDEFDRLNDEFEKTVRASVITAIELDEERKQKLASSFANVVGAKKIIIDPIVDPGIIGGVILTIIFCQDYSVGTAIYFGFWHSVSAFCNAGFDILGGSNFADYIFHPFFNLILLIEVICGGLGFAVLLDIYQKRKWQKLSINSKLVLVTTGFLILIGSVFIFILEYGNQNTLGDLGLFDKVMVSTFMASMARTSGFSMLDIGSLTEPSLLLIMFLMFIGGSPASTGGGIKTTTIAVIFAAIWSLIRGREDVVIFERTVPPIVIFRAMSIFFVSAIVVFLMSMFLCLTEDIALSKILFESVSMFATVGLPTGTINEMDASSRIVIIFVMLMGRIGIISFAMALVIRKKKNKIRYPEDKFIIG